MTQRVLGRTIYDLFIADILSNGEAKNYLKLAERAVSQTRFLDALVEIRKAVFVEFEEDYNIFGWREYDGKTPDGLLSSVLRGGWRAPYWTRRKDGSRRTFMSQLTISKSTTKIGDFKPWS